MSWIEVESKIRVNDPVFARRKIKEIASFVKKEKKIDIYYSSQVNGFPKKSLRIRRKREIVEVNFKQWISYKHGVHAKKEVEFKVSDLKGFFDLLKDFGFKEWLKKEKTTELYKTKDGINIELNNVKKLGWFIEIEILCEKKDIEKSRKRIIKLIDRLQLNKKDIEKSGYTKMLMKKR